MINLNTPDPPSISIPFDKAQSGVIYSTSSALLVNSLAGSGKSSMLTELAFTCSDPSLYLAFNKEIVEDIRTTLPDRCNCSTIHAYGLSLIRQNQTKIKVDFWKYGRNLSYKMADAVNNLVGFHQSRLGGFSLNEMAITAHMFHIDEKFVPAAFSAWEQHRHNFDVISAGDMIAIPLMKGYTGNHYGLTLVDEAADLSRDKLALIQMISTDQIVFCADKDQAIYPFLGSDPDIFNLIKDVYDPELHHCNQTFRCPNEIINVAQGYVPSLWGQKEGGSVSSTNINRITSAEIPDDSLIVCRANAPLFEIANKLIQEKREFRISKKQIKRLKQRLKFLVGKLDAPTVTNLSAAIRTNHDKSMKKYKKNKWSTHALEDRKNTLLAIVNIGSTLQEAGDYLKKLERSSINTNGPRLSTIHSSKGLQSENLFFLKPKIGASIASKAHSWEKPIELKMIPYVATTRSLNHLTYIF